MSNPTLTENTFTSAGAGVANPMTLQGTINKTGMLLALVIAPALYTWQQTMENPGSATPWLIGGLIAGFVLCLITVFKQTWSPVTAPLYAIAEGLALGAISAMYEKSFHGLVLQAVMLTVGVLGMMLALYTMRILQATEKFMMVIVAATGAICLTYLVTMVLGFFHIQVPFIHGNGLMGIGFSIVVVVVAALNLIMDFGLIESGVNSKAPKYMEWYAGFSLLVTLVWLYLEILRLLSKLSSRRN
jgi:uncharacterized YccA/Bax inhibitor family protein